MVDEGGFAAAGVAGDHRAGLFGHHAQDWRGLFAFSGQGKLANLFFVIVRFTPFTPLHHVEGNVDIGHGQAILFAGAHIGAGVIVGDQALVRERAVVGAGTVVGRGASVDNDVTVGARVRIQSDVYLTAYSVVEDDVFLGPGAATTNDDTMGRLPEGYVMRGATLRRACRIGGRAVLVPGVEVGEEAYVAAGAVVTANVPPRAVVMGVPARVVREVPDGELLEGFR